MTKEEEYPKCNHPDNRGNKCIEENCPYGKDHLDMLAETAEPCEEMYWKGEEPHTKYVKCKDCESFSDCQIRKCMHAF